jgi:hypothetical protein
MILCIATIKAVVVTVIETYLILQILMRSEETLSRSAKTRPVGYAGFWKVRPL